MGKEEAEEERGREIQNMPRRAGISHSKKRRTRNTKIHQRLTSICFDAKKGCEQTTLHRKLPLEDNFISHNLLRTNRLLNFNAKLDVIYIHLFYCKLLQKVDRRSRRNINLVLIAENVFTDSYIS